METNTLTLETITRAPVSRAELPAYYGCAVCGAWHPEDWDGDCSNPRNIFEFDELNEKHGAEGWCEI